ncbi:MAG: 4-hydroxy-tetrahydrodipicolinate reductase [Thermoleophilia bacterium]|nr:4-hydroxy-tetrahydrodipicolinate reductase [Thermoleophilia bacterium]
MDVESGQLRVAVAGARGRMGALTCEAVVADKELQLVAAVDPAYTQEELGTKGRGERFRDLREAIINTRPDVVVDFTTPAAVLENVLTCISLGVPVVVGTTGLGPDDLAEIDEAARKAKTSVLVAPNFAMGAVLMMQFAQQAAKFFDACEIIELHHQAKLDAPSGTSRLTRSRIQEVWRQKGADKELPIHSVRLPGLVAHQEVIFGGLGEILTIRHDSLSRESFMPGVILAIKRVRQIQGLVVGLENIL